jgi:hypothetical protein
MEHHVARDLLAGYIDDDLEADTKTELEQHLKECDECRGLIDEVEAPVDLTSAVGEGDLGWDEKRMRKTVRRTLLRIVSGVVAIWVVGFVVIAFVSALAFQPLVIDRGDRARKAGIATWDLPVLVTPGASVDRWTTDATLLGRDLKVELVRFVGSEPQALGVFETDLGVFSFSESGVNAVNPYVGGSSRRFVPDRLPDGTVVTVQLLWLEQPISVADAQALIPDPSEATVLWAGFDVSPALPQGVDRFPGDPGLMLGYHTCEAPGILDRGGSFFSSGFAMSSGNVTGCFFQPASVALALEQTRRATANLASDADLIEALEASSSESLQNIENVATWLAENQPTVTALVITGPSRNVAHIVETSGAEDAVQLDVDFWNWLTP